MLLRPYSQDVAALEFVVVRGVVELHDKIAFLYVIKVAFGDGTIAYDGYCSVKRYVRILTSVKRYVRILTFQRN